MENISIDRLDKLRQRYRLSDTDFADLFAIIVEEVADGYLPSPEPRVVILVGAPGSGIIELEKVAGSILMERAVICNPDNLRDFHPLSRRLKRNYPDLYAGIITEYAQKWNDLLCAYCQDNRLNYILETTFSSGSYLEEKIGEIKNRGYVVDIMLLAVNPRFSLLGTYIHYENCLELLGFANKVSKVAHDLYFDAMPTAIQAITKNPIYDNIYIYSRSMEQEYSGLVEGLRLIAHNPQDVMKVYREEIGGPWHPKLKEYFQQSCADVIELMYKRSAQPSEIELFRDELGISVDFG
ncbi:zeta toxin family protein [Chryseobacterium sp. c4a]|uniref:zeta toxin family protein n=1 Tax=Chryseobacterium sp. c4a TaxID=1573582 RepID=UPI00135C20BC|nr:zeta toxin family protein [Chryseobacterium sp. c4a]